MKLKHLNTNNELFYKFQIFTIAIAILKTQLHSYINAALYTKLMPQGIRMAHWTNVGEAFSKHIAGVHDGH